MSRIGDGTNDAKGNIAMTMNTLKKNRFALAALATILVATTGIASADARDRDRMGGQERFETMDADGNGQVTFAEFFFFIV